MERATHPEEWPAPHGWSLERWHSLVKARVSLPACLHARSVRMLGSMRGSCHTYSRASLQNKDMQADRTLWPTLTSVGTPKSDVRGWPAPQCDTASNKYVWPFKQISNVICESMLFDITQ